MAHTKYCNLTDEELLREAYCTNDDYNDLAHELAMRLQQHIDASTMDDADVPVWAAKLCGD
jgi:hypothetical protein